MAKITETQKENIALMNADLGGSMSSAQIRVDSKGNPVLIIGLGGTGMDALLCAKQLINQRFNLPDVPNKATAIPSNIRVLGIDSDTTYFSKEEASGMKFASDEYVSISGSVESILMDDQLIPSYVKEWLDDPKRLYEKIKGQGTDGANGIRQSGRILLFNSIHKVLTAITNAVKHLLTDMLPSQRLQVFILSGISGGTGSGTFLDIPYIVREIIKQQGKSNYDIMGILFTPDVNISRIDNLEVQRYVKRNGFAALQELEYLMNMPAHIHDPFRQRYSDAFSVSSNDAPFSMCLFVSVIGKGGFVQKEPSERYRFAMSIAAEAICHFISSEGFSIDSFRNNVRTALSGITPAFPMLNVYSAVGASAAILPKSEVLEYLSGKMFLAMNELYDRCPNREEREFFLAKLGLDNLSVQALFDQNNPVLFAGGIENPAFARQALKATKLNVEDMGEKWLNHVRDNYEATIKECVDIYFGKFKSEIELCFSNFKEGPFFASRLISSEDSYCLNKALLASLESERRLINDYTPLILNNQKDQADLAYANFVNKFLDLTSSSRRDYYNNISKFYMDKAARMRCEYTVRFYDELIKKINDYNNELVDNLVGILEELKVVFEKNFNIVTGVKAATLDGVNTSYEWKMYDIKDDRELLEKLDLEVTQLDMENAVKDLMSALVDSFKKTRSKEDYDVSSFICDKISSTFSTTLSQSMDDFFRGRYQSDASREDAAREMISELKSRSVVMFPCTEGTRMVDILYLSMPENSGSVEAAARKDDDVSNNIIKSAYNNRISMFTYGAGISASHHNLMHLYEEGYYQFASASGGAKDVNMIGQHLYSSSSGLRDTDWFYLPSPLHDTLRPKSMITDTTEFVHKQNEEKRNQFNHARETGIIDNVGNVRFDEKITLAAIEAITFGENDIPAAKAAKAQLTKLVEDIKNAPVLFTINGMNYMNATEEDKIREDYVRNYGAWKYVEAMVEAYDAAVAKMSACDQVIDRENAEDGALKQLFDALSSRVIFREKTFFRYENKDGEKENVLNLLSISDNTEKEYFYYYHLLKKFCELEDNQRRYINRKAEKAHENDIPNEDIEIMKKIVAHVKESLAAVDDLEVELSSDNPSRNENIISKYKKLKAIAESSLAMME